jgi:hypothetical protein
VAGARLNLGEIEATLRRLHRTAACVSAVETLERLAAGYREVDRLLSEGVELLSYGGTRHLVELNHIVLCGVDPALRAQFQGHIAATERWFYDRPDAGVAALYDWSQINGGLPPVDLAAGQFLFAVSAPQLFLEGNRRTACLLASHTLVRAGAPPLVVTPEAFTRYAALADRCAALDRGAVASLLAREALAAELRSLIRALADPRLIAPDAPRRSALD